MLDWHVLQHGFHEDSLGGQCPPHQHASSELVIRQPPPRSLLPWKWRGGKDSVFHSHILICEFSFVVRQPRTLMLRVRKVFRKLFIFFHHSLVPTTRFPVTNAESRSHSWWNIKWFWKVRLWVQTSQPKEKGRQRVEGRNEERKEGRKKLEPCGGREENKLRRACPRPGWWRKMS